MAIDKSLSQTYGDLRKNRRVAYKPNKPEEANGYDSYPNVIPIGDIPHEKPFWEEEPPMVMRPGAPQPFGEETFGWSEYEDYLDKLPKGVIPLNFNEFLDQLDLSPHDFWGRKEKEFENLKAKGEIHPDLTFSKFIEIYLAPQNVEMHRGGIASIYPPKTRTK